MQKTAAFLKRPTSPLLVGPPWKQECSLSELLHGPDSLIYVFENFAIKNSQKWHKAQLNMVGKYNCHLLLANSRKNNNPKFKPIVTGDIWPAFQSCADVSLTFYLFTSVCNTAFICAGYAEKGREETLARQGRDAPD